MFSRPLGTPPGKNATSNRSWHVYHLKDSGHAPVSIKALSPLDFVLFTGCCGKESGLFRVSERDLKKFRACGLMLTEKGTKASFLIYFINPKAVYYMVLFCAGMAIAWPTLKTLL